MGKNEKTPIVINDKEYLITFTNDQINSYISLINIEKGIIKRIEIPARIPPGFHSTIFKVVRLYWLSDDDYLFTTNSSF